VKQKVHVLYILTKLELGGAQKVCLSLIEGLKKNNHFSGLISGSEGILLDHAKKLGNVFFLDSFKREIGLKNVFNEIKTFFKLIKKIRKLKKQYPDLIVHTHSTKAGILGRWAAFFARVKVRVHTVHGFIFHEHLSCIAWWLSYIVELFTSVVTTHFVCVSYYDINIGKKYLPRFEKKSSVIRAAVDKDKFYVRGAVRVKKCIIGTVSCFKPQKNVFDLLKAFELLQQKPLHKVVTLQIIGDGTLREEIEQWIAQHNLQDRVELLGWQNDVASYLKHWNIFVLSSLWEGLPCTVVEARLSKVPVVSYRTAGIPEVIFDGKNGFLVDVGQWKELSKKMELLVRDDALLHTMRNYKDNLSDFDNRNMVQYHLQLYSKLLLQK
jgi:glycosyltransferase involved in cell wall biosynthesis